MFIAVGIDAYQGSTLSLTREIQDVNDAMIAVKDGTGNDLERQLGSSQSGDDGLLPRSR